MHIEDRLRGVGEALGAAGIPWLPLKGCDLGARAYRDPEERPVGDIDMRLLAWHQLAVHPDHAAEP